LRPNEEKLYTQPGVLWLLPKKSWKKISDRKKDNDGGSTVTSVKKKENHGKKKLRELGSSSKLNELKSEVWLGRWRGFS